MQMIDAEEFLIRVKNDPAYASTLTEPVHVSVTIEISDSEISALSPFLHFGIARFRNCPNLRIAEGNFEDVTFENCGIEETKNLTAIDAEFIDCPNLKVADGLYRNACGYQRCAIERLSDDLSGNIFFLDCPNLVLKEEDFWGNGICILSEGEKLTRLADFGITLPMAT